jgi:hypothetical protein
MKSILRVIFTIISAVLMLVTLMPMTEPNSAVPILSIAGIISLAALAMSNWFPTGQGAKGVVHNPTPPFDPKSAGAGRCSNKVAQIARITQADPDSGVEVDDLVLMVYKRPEEICHGTKVKLTIKDGRLEDFAGIAGTPFKYSRFQGKD